MIGNCLERTMPEPNHAKSPPTGIVAALAGERERRCSRWPRNRPLFAPRPIVN